MDHFTQRVVINELEHRNSCFLVENEVAKETILERISGASKKLLKNNEIKVFPINHLKLNLRQIEV